MPNLNSYIAQSYISNTPEETMAYACKLAKLIPPEAFIAFDGDLGSGKTTFIKGFAKGLGVKEIIKSPTYNIYSIYKTSNNANFVHIDAYRLKDYSDFEDLLLDELAPSPRIICMEWASLMKDFLPDDTIWIKLEICDDFKHKITIEKSL